MNPYQSVPTCEKHPTKLARKLCWTCKKPLCKVCGYEKDLHYYCDNCQEKSDKVTSKT